MKNLALTFIAYATAFLVVVTLGAILVLSWMFLEPAVSSVKYTSWCLKNTSGECATEFKAGDVFYVHREFIVTRDASFTIVRSIVNEDTGVTLLRSAPVNTYWKKGPGTRTLAHPITEFATPGNYSFKTQLMYQVNPLRPEVPADAPLMYFKVVK